MTREHGVGALKQRWCARVAGERSRQARRAVRQAFDPLHVLNPGKLVSPAA